MTASFVRRYPGGFRGLGQDGGDAISTDIGTQTGIDIAAQAAGSLSLPPVTVSDAGVAATTLSSQPWYAPILAGATAGGTKIASQYASYANPLYQKSTVALNPQGQVILATNQPTGSAAAASAVS